MSRTILELTSSAALRALETTAEDVIKLGGGRLSTILKAQLPGILASSAGTFVPAFATAVLNGLLASEDSLRRIERMISKLARAPMRTALDRFRIAAELHARSSEEGAYREQRFKDCLLSLDSAMSLAEPPEVPLIMLLRGVCALQIRGGMEEARRHLKQYQQYCRDEAESLGMAADEQDQLATEQETEAASISVPRGPGVGGGLVGMAFAEPRIRKAELLRRALVARDTAAKMRQSAQQFIHTEECIAILGAIEGS